ncbi:MAG: hypothetical protein CV087_05665 [Candidatus Brocadia sp. WS118]|nr:MAG: hypothetical protein CV087_05665 [Candidatus Brocadia sp. WS118]
MALIGLIGKSQRGINQELIQYAIKALPAILIDCANSADPHRYYPQVNLEIMQRIYVFELELLHKFRDVLRRVPLYAKKLQVKIIVVTTSDHLLNYHNEKENRDINIHAWELMRKIGDSHDIVVGVYPNSEQYTFAQKYCREIRGN